MLIYVFALSTTFPVGDKFNAPVLVIVTPVPTMLLVLMLAPVILPVAVICPTVLKLAPIILPVAVINPPVLTLAAVTLPLAEINPVMLAPESQNSARRFPDRVLPVKNLIVLPEVCVAIPMLPPLTYKYPSLATNAV